MIVAVAVSTVVDQAARRSRQAARARAEAEALATLSGDVLRGERTLPALLARARELFGLQEIRLLEQVDGTDVVVVSAGEPGQDGQVTEVPVADGARLVLRSQLPDGVRQEVWAYLCVHHAIRWLMHTVALEADTDPDRLSFTRTLRVARRTTASHPGFSP